MHIPPPDTVLNGPNHFLRIVIINVIVLVFSLFQELLFFNIKVVKSGDTCVADLLCALELFQEVWLVDVDGSRKLSIPSWAWVASWSTGSIHEGCRRLHPPLRCLAPLGYHLLFELILPLPYLTDRSETTILWQ